MWIFPVSLLLTIVRGRLVLFGGDRAAPNLRTFGTLAEDIAEQPQRTYPDDELNPDQFLPRLGDEGVIVDRLVQKVIGCSPGPLHEHVASYTSLTGVVSGLYSTASIRTFAVLSCGHEQTTEPHRLRNRSPGTLI